MDDPFTPIWMVWELPVPAFIADAYLAHALQNALLRR